MARPKKSKAVVAKSMKKIVSKAVVKKTKKPLKKVKKLVKKAKKILAQPKGYASVTPYLIVDNGKKAIEFYKKAFGAKEMFRLDAPDGKIGHAV